MSTKKEENRGRKPLPEDERRTAQIRLWVTDEEKEVISQAAPGPRELAKWAREVLLRAARRKK